MASDDKDRKVKMPSSSLEKPLTFDCKSVKLSRISSHNKSSRINNILSFVQIKGSSKSNVEITSILR